MALRATMAALITKTRRKIGDTAGASQVFGDEEIQEVLDRHRREARYAKLTPVETIASGGGSVSYLTFKAPVGDWEGSPSLVNSTFAALTPATFDLDTGRWTFSAEPDYPVLITGWHYDLNAAAADLLEEWASKEKLNFDFSQDGASFKESQKVAALLELAAKFRKRRLAGSAAYCVTDAN